MILAEDIDGDGRDDVMIESGTTHSLWLQKADGTLGAPTAVPTHGRMTFAMALAQVTGTVARDLVSLELDDNLDTVLNVSPGNGDGTFDAPTTHPMPPNEDPIYRSLDLVDLNADGRLDAVMAQYHSTFVLLQDEDGDFSRGCRGPGGGGVLSHWGGQAQAVGDVTGDGIVDAVHSTNLGMLVAVGRPLGVRTVSSLGVRAWPDRSITLGGEVELRGSVVFGASACETTRDTVGIWRTLPGGQPEKIADAPLDGVLGWEQGFELTDSPPVAGNVIYEARWGGDDAHRAAAPVSIEVRVARRKTTLRFDRTPRKVEFGDPVRLSAVLDGGGPDRAVEIYGRWDGVEHLIESIVPDASGEVRTTHVPLEKTVYSARYAGDEEWLPSVGGGLETVVVAITKGRMLRFQDRAGKYAIYRPTKRVFYGTAVQPAHPGGRVNIALEFDRGGGWRNGGNEAFRLGNDGSLVIYLQPGALPPDLLYRFRTRFRGDRDHEGSYSDWSYFKIRKATSARLVASPRDDPVASIDPSDPPVRADVWTR